MSVSDVFKRLGAPLKNQRWSWGAVREKDGTVVLRVWQDQGRRIDGRYVTRVTHHASFLRDPENLGYAERLGHVELVRAGAPCYLVMCEAKDVDAVPRDIKSVNEREVFLGGALTEIDGDIWIERVKRLSIADAV